MFAFRNLPRLLIRADGSFTMGSGHLMRCISLVQAWKDFGGSSVLLTSDISPFARERYQAEECEIRLLPKTITSGSKADADFIAQVAAEKGCAGIVIDGYHFSAEFQRDVKAGVPTVGILVLDDHGHATQYSCDWVINPNVYASKEIYRSREKHTCLLLGSKYAPIRREFRNHSRRKRIPGQPVTKLLMTMGGGDVPNFSLKGLEALRTMKEVSEVTVVVGSENPHRPSLVEAAKSLSGIVRLETGKKNMPELLDVDLALSAAGSTSAELCFLGVPTVLVVTAENQRQVAEGLAEAGAAINLGWHEDVNPQKIADTLARLIANPIERERLSQQMLTLVDGQGAVRVVTELLELHFREAVLSDSDQLFEWRNDPLTRENSKTTERITREQHDSWLEASLKNSGRKLYVVEVAGQAIATVRLDRTGSGWELSWTIDPQARGKGLGKRVVKAATDLVNDEIIARIKEGNVSSRKIAESAEFKLVGQSNGLMEWKLGR